MADKDRDLVDDTKNPTRYSEDPFDEEMGAETAIDHRDIPVTDSDEREGGTGLGIIGMVLSVLAFFFLPVILGAAGIIVGIIAARQGARALGGWAIGIGIAAIVIKLFVAPFF